MFPPLIISTSDAGELNSVYIFFKTLEITIIYDIMMVMSG